MILVESSHLIGSYLADLIRWDKSITNRIRIVWNSEKKIESQAVIYILIAFTTFAVTKDSFDRTAKVMNPVQNGRSKGMKADDL